MSMSISSTLFPLLEETNSGETLEDDSLKIPPDAFQLLTNSSSSSVSSGVEPDLGLGFQVPKAFQAVATLLVCAILLIGTLGIIQQYKRMCGKGHGHVRREAMELAAPQESTDYYRDADDPDYLRANEDVENQRHSGQFSKNFMHYQPSSRPQTPQNVGEPAKVQSRGQGPSQPLKSILVKQQSLTKAAKEVFVRRTSGPFGDDAIDFYGESYKKKPKVPKTPAGAEAADSSTASKTKNVPSDAK